MAKLMQISDLHLGLRLKEFSLIEDQRYILEQIIRAVDEEKPSALLICGDVFDKKIPSEEAVKLFDGFLCKLSERGLQTFIISGNHDSAERLAYAGSFLEKGQIYVTAKPEEIRAVPLNCDPNVVIYGIPFITPAEARALYPDGGIVNYTDAVREIIAHIEIDSSKTNILLAHQYVTDGEEDEESSVGSLEKVDGAVFAPFDYVALGHMHRAYPTDKTGKIRYCGSPMKYTRDEADHEKSITVIETDKKKMNFRKIPLKPLHDMKILQGEFETLMSRESYSNLNRDDYYFVVLTDEEYVADVISKMRAVYPNILSIEYRNSKTEAVRNAVLPNVKEESPFEQFSRFFSNRSGGELTEEQADYARALFEKLEQED